TMGKVLVTASIENLVDLYRVKNGLISADQVRSIHIQDALVDTGAVGLSLPQRFIMQLNLERTRTRLARTSADSISVQVYSPVRLTIQGRDCLCEVEELPDECTVVI